VAESLRPKHATAVMRECVLLLTPVRPPVVADDVMQQVPVRVYYTVAVCPIR